MKQNQTSLQLSLPRESHESPSSISKMSKLSEMRKINKIIQIWNTCVHSGDFSGQVGEKGKKKLVHSLQNLSRRTLLTAQGHFGGGRHKVKCFGTKQNKWQLSK